jgi:hypothetical protein
MAAPHVSGAAALLLAAYPGLSYQAALARLYGSADRVSALDGKVATGRLNVARAIEADTRAPGAPALSSIPALATRTSVALAWTAPDEDGALGAGAASTYLLRYRLAGTAAWDDAPAPRPGSPGTLQSAVVGGLRPGRTYELLLVAIDNVGNSSSSPVLVTATKPGIEVLFDDLEGGSAWTASPPWGLVSDRFHSPIRAWSDSPAGPYRNGIDASVASRAFSLAGARNPTLSFWRRYNLEKSRDIGSVEVSRDGGSTWTALATMTGGADWAPVDVDLGPYVGAASVRVRFRIVTDTSNVNEGWLIDDVIVSADP